MSAPNRAAIENAITNRIAYRAATDADVPGRAGSSAALQAIYDGASLGFRVLVENGNRYTKTSMTLYADGGRITQEDATGSFVPPDDDLTDLGDPTHRFRTLYLGTSIQNDGDLTAVLTGSATRTFFVGNPTPGQVANIVTNGGIYVGADYLDPASLTAPATGVAQIGISESIAGLRVTSNSAGVNGVNVRNAITANAPRIEAYGDDGSILLEIASKGAAPIDLLRNDGNTSTVTTALRVAHTTTGTAGVGIGVRVGLDIENASGARSTVGALQAVSTNVTSGSESAVVDLLPSSGGGLSDAGLRVRSTAPASVNGLEVIAAVGGGGIVYAGIYGSDPDVFLRLRNRGTGAIQFRNSADTQTGWGIEHTTGTTVGPIASHAASTAGGSVTLNAVIGQFRIAAGQGAAGITISNETVKDGRTVVTLQPKGIDVTATRFAVVASAGAFTVTTDANATADLDVGFLVVNAG